MTYFPDFFERFLDVACVPFFFAVFFGGNWLPFERKFCGVAVGC
jgi:hypothetical protein